MLVGELVVNLHPTHVGLELFTKKKNIRTLVAKHRENYSISFSSFNKIDTMDIEALVKNFLKGTTIKAGVVRFVIYSDKSVTDFHEFSLDTTSKKEILHMLPLEIESRGENLEGVPYRYKIYGSKVYTHFMLRNLVDTLSSFEIGPSWQVISIVSSVVAYEGLFQSDGLLVEINSDTYTIFAARSGFIYQLETFATYSEFSLNRSNTPLESELFDAIKADLADYVHRYKFSENVQFDLVFLNFTGDVIQDFTGEDYENNYYAKPEDLRKWLAVAGNPEEYRSNAYTGTTVALNYDVGTLGMFYGENQGLASYNFAPEKLSRVHRKILVSALTFSMLLAFMLPGFGIYTDKYVSDISETSATHKVDIAALQSTLTSLDESIKSKDTVIEDYNSYVSSLSELTDMNRNFISSVLSYLPSNTPTGVVINELKLDKSSKKLVVKGISKTYKDIGALAIELEEFGSVDVDKIENNDLINEKGYPFELSLVSK